MITENLSTLKIHKLTQAQYDRELAAGRIDENALYLTPDEEIDLSKYATKEELNTKANTDHNHDDVYYTETEVNAMISETTSNIQTQLDNKMNTFNPVCTGSFSMNRKEGTTIGNYSHAEGSNTTASGHYSHAEGRNTTASGNYSHAEGRNTTASGESSHAEGLETTASENYSHAEGQGTTASGESAHAEGAITSASGWSSHAGGFGTLAKGDGSHAEGEGTIASGEWQHVQGRYNIEDTEGIFAHIVGNGTDEENRSNAHTLDWEGNAWFAGDVVSTDANGNSISLNELNSTTQMLRVGTYTELLTCQAKTWRGYTFKNLPEHTFSFPIIAGVGDNGQLEGCQVIRDFSEVGKILVYSPIAQNVNVMLVVMN